MDSDNGKLGKLVERIDELLVVLKNISEDLRAVSASLKTSPTPQTSPRISQSPLLVSPRTSKKEKLDDVRLAFPEDLDHLLEFKDESDFIMVKPKGYLGSENFARIASAIRGMGGEYISAGRDSHFRVYKKKP